MKHILDNPAWSALTSGNKNLSNGSDTVKYFNKDVSPFVGFKENNEESFDQLYQLITQERTLGFISPDEVDIPAAWEVILALPCFQMIYAGEVAQPDAAIKIVPLTDSHIPQMLALTQLTNPGPFAERTIDFGHYYGVFDKDQLVAMAGQRMHIFNYAEISAVCTHPDHLGRGYAKALLQYQANRILNAGDTPMLHVRFDNHRAVQVYESLGFYKRKEIFFYIIKK
ncbi:hypothetical protein A0256_04940 [Mucilaginibacter sp. PAMC 26640]|nr:hypothetical protein A0256_04940 [Mucilaginibacter sp. PAMC 26640]